LNAPYSYGIHVLDGAICKTDDALWLETAETIVDNLRIYETNYYGIYVGATQNWGYHSIISNCIVRDADLDDTGCAAIVLDNGTKSYTLRDNIVENTTGYSGGSIGIQVVNGYPNATYGNIIERSNYVIGYGSSNWRLGSTYYSSNRVPTENSGTATSVSNGDWQAHGLAGSPTLVLLTGDDNNYVWCSGRNSTHFQFGVAAGTPDINWYAEHYP